MRQILSLLFLASFAFADLFDAQNYGDLSQYGKFGTISVSISGGTMEFLGKRRKYSPIQKLITLGESGSFKVYCYESDCRNNAPEPLYYSYRINHGMFELFIDSIADSPIRILVDNSILKQNQRVENISVNPQNSTLKPMGVTIQLLGIGTRQ